MEIPKCRNFLEGTCERSDIVLSENRDGKSYTLFCRTCQSVHVWTRSKIKAQARQQNILKRRREMTDREQRLARQAVRFLPPKRGWV